MNTLWDNISAFIRLPLYINFTNWAQANQSFDVAYYCSSLEYFLYYAFFAVMFIKRSLDSLSEENVLLLAGYNTKLYRREIQK